MVVYLEFVFGSLLQRLGVNDPSKRQEKYLTFSRWTKLICNLPSLIGLQPPLRYSDVNVSFSFLPAGASRTQTRR